MMIETRVYSSYHPSQFDNAVLNEAIQKAIKDKEFINSSLNLLKNAKHSACRWTRSAN